MQKYQGREELIAKEVPFLNCKWNDVVHFSSLNPSIIAKEILKINPDQKFKRLQYFKVHIDQIIKNKAVVFNSEVSTPINTYQELTSIPKATIDYWDQAKTNNRPLLWFMHIPHVLVLGEVETKDFEVFDLI